MKALLIQPAFPVTYWGFQHGLPLGGYDVSLPPLGLITLAAMLPSTWQLRLLDLNMHTLRDADILAADVVLIGGMRIQAESMHAVIERARRLGRRTVVGGPAPTTAPAEYKSADVVFVGEVEGRVDELLEAIERPAPGCQVLAPLSDHKPNLELSPVPRFDLLELKRYASVSVQTSRGCPFRCEFCDIIAIFGRVPRIKQPAQVLAELEALRELGHSGSTFIVDDNFIGNRKATRKLVLAIATWQKERGYPFELYTEASVNLATDPGLTETMVRAGFSAVFLGIETPSSEALAESGKSQNLALDLREVVTTITDAGLEVMGGFIVGFDSDGPDIFASMRDFVESVPLPLAMVGLMMALPETALWRRLDREGRLRKMATGDQFGRPNFEPTMHERALLVGYRDLMAALYSPDAWFDRCESWLLRAPALPGGKAHTLHHVGTFFRLIWGVGLRSPYRRRFWRILWLALRRAPWQTTWAMGHVVQGVHMIRYTAEELVPRMNVAIAILDSEQAADSGAEPQAAVA